jgi:hypothetical protein
LPAVLAGEAIRNDGNPGEDATAASDRETPIKTVPGKRGPAQEFRLRHEGETEENGRK